MIHTDLDIRVFSPEKFQSGICSTGVQGAKPAIQALCPELVFLFCHLMAKR